MNDGEMDVRSVAGGLEARCGFVQSSGCAERRWGGGAGWIGVVWACG